jgi:hypothetical protein
VATTAQWGRVSGKIAQKIAFIQPILKLPLKDSNGDNVILERRYFPDRRKSHYQHEHEHKELNA